MSDGKLKVTQVTQSSSLKYLKSYVIKYLTKSGKEAVWELVSRGDLKRLKGEIFHQESVSDGTVIFATNASRDLVVVLKEYRVSAGRHVYMLPAGLADPGESVAVTAVREFKEETGLDFEPVRVEPARYLSVGIVNEKANVVYGYYSGQPSKAHQADNEDAEILFIGKEEAERLLAEEEVSMRTALLLQDFFRLNAFFNV